MLQIRRGTFETNSSSTHSIAIYTDAEYKDRMEKEKNPNYLTDWDDDFYTIDEIIFKYENSSFRSDREAVAKIKEFMNGRELKDCLDDEIEEGESFEEWLNDNLELKSVNYRNGDYDDYNRLEEDYTKYTTPGGEHLHIICKYGYDG